MSDLSAETISRFLTTRRLGRPTLFFEQIGSTNDLAHEQARGGAPDGLLVVADEQTGGRGRLGRTWWAPPGTCLLMSLVLRPALPLTRSGQLTMCLGLGAVEGIAAQTGAAAALKWPNDLLLRGRKLGGMLTELDTVGGQLNYAVLGLGLNVNVSFDQPLAPEALAETATSLMTSTGNEIDRLALLAAILQRTEYWYDRTLRGDSPHEAWARRLDTLNQRVAVSLVEGRMEGVATGVTPEGGLLVRDDDGTTHTVWSGDVTTVRS